MKNEQYFEYIRSILLENDIEKLNTIIFGSCNNALMIVLYFKEYVVIFNDKNLFEKKYIKLNQNEFKKYMYFHDKGKNYLMCSFDYMKSYDFKIDIKDVKIPKTKLSGEKIKNVKKLSSLFKNGEIVFNKINSDENRGKDLKESNGVKIPIIYLIVFLGLVNLIITTMIIIIVYFKS